MRTQLTYFYRWLASLAAAPLLIALLGPTPASAQVNNPAYADYLLVGRFGEICTMCEAIVLCETDEHRTNTDEIPASGSFSVYHLQTRTFWSQIATIWEWFVVTFDSEALATGGHDRPVYSYDVTDGRWSERKEITARLTLEPALIDLGDRSIERVEGLWLQGRERRPVGSCRRLPLWESLDVIAAKAPRKPAA